MKRIIFIQIENHFVDLNYTCTKASIKNLWSTYQTNDDSEVGTVGSIPLETN